MLKKFRTILILLLALVLGCSITFYVLLKQNIQQPVVLDAPLLVTIKPGTSFNRFSKQLVTLGVIDSRFWLRGYAKLNPTYSKIKAGTYQLLPEQRIIDVLNDVVSGKEFQYSITFVEGSTLKQWLSQLSQHEAVVQTLDYANKNTLYLQVGQALAIENPHPEGLFFPETYSFVHGTKDVEILKRAQRKMTQELNDAWQNRLGNLPYQTPYQALIMASIIEKESGLLAEHQTIASVFVNRLHKGMRLQTDPTVIYGLGERYQGDIKRVHLKEKTAYNTYRINGLPPTPIAMPGKSAIIAALQPEDTDYYYFVSNGSGQHIFSTNLQDHNKAVRQYLLSN